MAPAKRFITHAREELPMNESKIELTHRLHREGRWDEASRFKDETISRMRSEGLSRNDARERAWEALEGRFPPLPTEAAVAQPQVTWDQFDDVPSDTPGSFTRDVPWVYDRLAVADLEPADAPSPGAWSLLQW